MRRILAIVAAGVTLAGAAWAHEFKVGDITIDHPWARPSTGANGGAYFVIRSDSAADDRLIAASGDVAEAIELHTHETVDGVMRMRPVSGGVTVPGGRHVDFEPGGLHVMMIGLTRSLEEGDEFPLTLTFENAGSVDVTVHVHKDGPDSHDSHEGHHHH